MERNLLMKLGNLILKYRKKCNLSQEALAKEIGVTRQTISKWELNETTPDLKQAIKLAELFKISIDELIKENKTENIPKKERKNNHIKFAFICYLLLLLLIIIGVATTFYYFGYNITIARGSIAVVCTLENEEYGFNITYDDTHDILMTEGSEYIFNNIYNRKKHKNAVDLITDINNYFKERDGFCE